MAPATHSGIDGASGEVLTAPGAGPTLTVEVVRLDPDLPLPGYARAGDAGADLVARTAVTLPPGGGRALVPTGIALAIPLGTVKSRLHHAIKLLRDDPHARRFFVEE